MEFKVKQFAQVMLLCHEVVLAYDEISGGNTMIDLYQIMEHPQIVKGKVEDFMKDTYNSAMSDTEYKNLYERLYIAENDQLFWELLKIKNENQRKGRIIK